MYNMYSVIMYIYIIYICIIYIYNVIRYIYIYNVIRYIYIYIYIYMCVCVYINKSYYKISYWLKKKVYEVYVHLMIVKRMKFRVVCLSCFVV